jgi:hypothetical protein
MARNKFSGDVVKKIAAAEVNFEEMMPVVVIVGEEI